METINERINLIVKAKTGERRKLAELMHVSPQYVNKIATPGGSVGIEPVITLLRLFPDINARWLLLGEGEPFSLSKSAEDVRRNIGGRVAFLLEVDRYIPYMEPGELDDIKGKIDAGSYILDAETVSLWEERRKQAAEILAPNKKI